MTKSASKPGAILPLVLCNPIRYAGARDMYLFIAKMGKPLALALFQNKESPIK